MPEEPSSFEWRRLGPPVRESEAGSRLDTYLAREFRFLSRSGWQKRIDDGTLCVNGEASKASVRVKPGDLLTMYAPIQVEPEVDRGIRVLWEKAGVAAVFKPGNLPMHENGPYRNNTFAVILAEQVGPEWAACHRLDRETSGIVLCGSTAAIRAELAEDFGKRRIHKEYLAIGRGRPAAARWEVDGPIGDLVESQIRIKKWVVAGGLPAQTFFETLAVGPEACLLRAKPITGRTNQIRIHAAWSGHVLYGDKLYHPDEAVFLDYFENRATTPWVVEMTGFPRCALHASAMEFTHPDTGERVRVEAELPLDLSGLWQRLGGDSPSLPSCRASPPALSCQP